MMSQNHHVSQWDHLGRRCPRRGLIAVTLFAAFVCGQFLLAQGKSKDPAITRADEKPRKFVNKIPYDVFYDNPLQVVNNNKTAVPSTESATEKPSEVKSAHRPTPTAGTNAGIVWKEFLPIGELQGEVKTVRNNLAKWISNQGQFNQNFKYIAIDGEEIAALAGIVQQHDESIGWKDKAQFVRDFRNWISPPSGWAKRILRRPNRHFKN